MASGHICFSGQPSAKALHAYTSRTRTHLHTRARAFFYPSHTLPCSMCIRVLTHVFLTRICFPECIQHTWFAHTYVSLRHVFLPTDTKHFSPFHTHAHASSHKHFSPRRVFPAQSALPRPRSSRRAFHTASPGYALILSPVFIHVDLCSSHHACRCTHSPLPFLPWYKALPFVITVITTAQGKCR